MRFFDITESSPNTFKGSLTPDLVKSKLWLCETLKNLGFSDFDTIYILGSWYGNTAIALNRSNIDFTKIINVDIDRVVLKQSKDLLSQLGIDSTYLNKDANKLSYSQLNPNSLIINTSINDINGMDWFNNIPAGTLILLQSRNNVSNGIKNLKEFDERFTLNETLFLGQKTLVDPETEYQRFMKIGIV